MSSTEKQDTTYKPPPGSSAAKRMAIQRGEDGYNLDPVCIFHHLRQSEHVCLVCCLCFSDMTIEEAGETGEDVCIACKELEAKGEDA